MQLPVILEYALPLALVLAVAVGLSFLKAALLRWSEKLGSR